LLQATLYPCLEIWLGSTLKFVSLHNLLKTNRHVSLISQWLEQSPKNVAMFPSSLDSSQQNLHIKGTSIGSGPGGGLSADEMMAQINDFIHKPVPVPKIPTSADQLLHNKLFQFQPGLPGTLTDLMDQQEPFMQLLEAKRLKYATILQDEHWMKWQPFSPELNVMISNMMLDPTFMTKVNLFLRKHQDLGTFITMMSGMMPHGFV
jgi:hypothetical protein